MIFAGLIFSCQNNQEKKELNRQLTQAIAEKTIAEKELASFKAQEAAAFKIFDSLKAKNKISPQQQHSHDSLFQEGVKAGMKIVHTQMKINELKKQLE
jgi:hypothetical protein